MSMLCSMRAIVSEGGRTVIVLSGVHMYDLLVMTPGSKPFSISSSSLLS